MKILLVRSEKGLAAADDTAHEVLSGIGLGEVVRAEIRRPRNLKQHRHYWGLCSLVAINHEELKTARQVDGALKLLTGHWDPVGMPDGTILKVPRSIAFDALPQDEWLPFWKDAKHQVVVSLLPGVRLADVENEILRMCI